MTFRKKRVAESLIFRKSRIAALQQTIASDRAQPASSWRDARIKKNQKSLSYLLNAKTGLTDGLPPNWPNVSDDDIKHWVLENAREPSRQVVNMGRRRRR